MKFRSHSNEFGFGNGRRGRATAELYSDRSIRKNRRDTEFFMVSIKRFLQRSQRYTCDARFVSGSTGLNSAKLAGILENNHEVIKEKFGLVREFGLLQATALNMSNMVGVGPFITIPL